LKDKSEEEIEEYIKAHKLEKVKVEDILKAEVNTIDPNDLQSFEPEPEVPETPVNPEQK